MKESTGRYFLAGLDLKASFRKSKWNVPFYYEALKAAKAIITENPAAPAGEEP